MVFDSIKLSTTIDYVGQRRTELVFQILISVFSVIGFAWGFHVQDFSQTLLILAAGVVLSSLVVLPPWPFWKRNLLKWQKASPKTDPSTSSPKPATNKTVSKESNKKVDSKKK